MLRINRKAQTILEYTILIAIVFTVFLAMGRYMTRAVSGRWKGVGESFGHGRQYDPHISLECKYDYVYTNSWYNAACFRQTCDCSSLTRTQVSCQDCIVSCQVTGLCDDTELSPLPSTHN